MFKRPAVLAINSQAPSLSDAVPLALRLQNAGNNTGNVVFSEALYSVLNNAKRLSYHFGADDLKDCDVVVVAAANWINPHSDFGFLSDRLEKSGLPVVLCGLGAQVATGAKLGELKAGTFKLLQLAARTSGAIFVRGDFSLEVMRGLGFDKAASTGCPSLLLAGPRKPVIRRYKDLTTADVAIHSTRHLHNVVEGGVHAYLYQQAMKLDCDLLLQSELIDIHLAADDPMEPTRVTRAHQIMAATYRADVPAVTEYLKRRAKWYFSLEGMLRYLASKKFVFGTRIHATIAALLAGTPALLVTHDCRTLELAQRLNVPYITQDQLGMEGDIDFASFNIEKQLDLFEERYGQYRLNFLNRFKAHGLVMNPLFPGVEV